jgi:hypothetical protein
MKKGSKKRKAKTCKILQKEDFELDEVDYKILQLTLDYKTLSDREIGELIGYTRQQVNLRKQKPAFKKAIELRFLKAIEILDSLKTPAAIKIGEHMESKDEKVSLKACEDILGDVLKEKSTDKQPIEVIIKYV